LNFLSEKCYKACYTVIIIIFHILFKQNFDKETDMWTCTAKKCLTYQNIQNKIIGRKCFFLKHSLLFLYSKILLIDVTIKHECNKLNWAITTADIFSLVILFYPTDSTFALILRQQPRAQFYKTFWRLFRRLTLLTRLS